MYKIYLRNVSAILRKFFKLCNYTINSKWCEVDAFERSEIALKHKFHHFEIFNNYSNENKFTDLSATFQLVEFNDDVYKKTYAWIDRYIDDQNNHLFSDIYVYLTNIV